MDSHDKFIIILISALVVIAFSTFMIFNNAENIRDMYCEETCLDFDLEYTGNYELGLNKKVPRYCECNGIMKKNFVSDFTETWCV